MSWYAKATVSDFRKTKKTHCLKQFLTPLANVSQVLSSTCEAGMHVSLTARFKAGAALFRFQTT